MSYGGLQLEMNFDSSMNRFQNCLDNGVFVMLVEQSAPTTGTDPAIAGERLQELEYAVLNINELPTGLAITDRFGTPDTWSASQYAASLSPDTRDRHVIYISGRDATMEEAGEKVKLCSAGGFRNIVPVSGNLYPGETFKSGRNMVFSDSVCQLEMLRRIKAENPFFCGCVCNPYKYAPKDLFPQYLKLIKKLDHGARFVVTQIGWDMLKLQELRWYLGYRGLHFPTIARLMILTPERLEKLQGGHVPGVRISPDFNTILENELKYSHNQFEAAQWRRLELQAAGCRLLGFSGIQIAGLDSPDKVRVAAKRVTSALNEFRNFDDWKQEYIEHLARAEMAPYPNCFYLFDKLFSSAHLDGTAEMTQFNSEGLSKREKRLYRLRKFMFPHADRQNPGAHFIAKKLFAGCQECSHCRLPQTFFVCPETCPKGLANGPCGGTRADGSCELGEQECTHSKMMRLAAWRRKVHRLEERYIEPVERVIG
ncbi:methylenetetrahydrofolate reductase C-terminal domain-containing protein [Lentisphaerota bacterium ZTH]|nr:methylenetetrahydrofolate reductase C-terminal domain-containing protein [Lentisphaerota bacterium]WET05647.1 methylenetetrahydrofolate reductase C-terminal domain-containing protein [Lentisphaerota bacterium ZTH]